MTFVICRSDLGCDAATLQVLTLVYSLEQLCCFRDLEPSPLVVSLQEAHAGSAHLSLQGDLDWREDKSPQEGAVCQTSEGLAISQE
jgi:hypothetical protein